MKTYRFELYGTITRDIIWREAEFESEEEARAAVAEAYPTYRVNCLIIVPPEAHQ